MRSPRFLLLCLLLLVTFGILQLRGDTDRVPSSTPLTQFPERIGPWSGTDIPLNAVILDVLGKGVFLDREYSPSGTSAPADAVNTANDRIGLFIGYFPTQRTGQSIHSPQNCLPGAGWTFERRGVTDIADDSGKTSRVGEYVISNGVYKQEVLYWYRSHGRSIASDYMAKLYMLRDAIVYDRTDAALIRVITPIQPGETQADAHQRAVSFTRRITSLLPAYIPD